MTAARESTDAQWEAYYAARVEAVRLSGELNRALAKACRLNPGLTTYDAEFDALDYERMAIQCDRLAAELKSGEIA